MLFFRLLSRLPFWALYLLADLLFPVLYGIIRYRRDVVYDNLQRAFPEKQDKEIRRISKAYYRNLAQVVVETIKVLTAKKEVLKRRIEFHNLDIYEDYLRNGSSVFILASHMCNWEWVATGFRLYSAYEATGVYKPLKSDLFDRLLIAVRNRFSNTPLIPKDIAVKEILRTHKDCKGYGLAADQSPAASDAKYWTRFLGRETAFFTGPKFLTELTGMPAIYADMQRTGKGKYSITVSKIAEPPYDANDNPVLERFVRTLEKSVRESPSDWLWSHKRWKHVKEPAE